MKIFKFIQLIFWILSMLYWILSNNKSIIIKTIGLKSAPSAEEQIMEKG